jgi:ethanolamine transporter EutH
LLFSVISPRSGWQRRFQEGFQAIGGTNGLRFGVIESAKIAKRLEKLQAPGSGQENRQKG